eukprot:8583247-Lingulodinium_polyedra.AAC.1
MLDCCLRSARSKIHERQVVSVVASRLRGSSSVTTTSPRGFGQNSSKWNCGRWKAESSLSAVIRSAWCLKTSTTS